MRDLTFGRPKQIYFRLSIKLSYPKLVDLVYVFRDTSPDSFYLKLLFAQNKGFVEINCFWTKIVAIFWRLWFLFLIETFWFLKKCFPFDFLPETILPEACLR